MCPILQKININNPPESTRVREFWDHIYSKHMRYYALGPVESRLYVARARVSKFRGQANDLLNQRVLLGG